MLRNPRIGHHGLSVRTLLNEVLSLNAQEFRGLRTLGCVPVSPQ